MQGSVAKLLYPPYQLRLMVTGQVYGINACPLAINIFTLILRYFEANIQVEGRNTFIRKKEEIESEGGREGGREREN